MNSRMVFKLILLGVLLQQAFARDYYVSIGGQDTNDGTEGAPFRTIQKAAQLAQAGEVVYIKSGVYRETVTPANNGTESSPIEFRAFGDGDVTITATEKLENWSEHDGSVYKATVGMSMGNQNMLYYNDQAMDLARWPNNTDDNPYSIDAHPVTGGSASHVEAANIPNIDWSGGYIWYLGAHSGASWTRPITNTSSSRVDFTAVDITKWPFNPHNPTVFRNGNRGRFYLMNALEALDFEREWYYKNNTVYFMAPGGENPNNANVEYAAREKALNITKSHIHFDGINVFGGGVYISGEYVVVKNGIFKHCMQVLDDLDNTSAQIGKGAFEVLGDYTTIENNIIEYGSANGILIKGYSGGENSLIRNNIIRHFNTIGNHSSLIRSTADGVKVLNNTAYSTGRDGFYVNSLNSEVAYNDVYQVMKINNDGGVFYVVGNDQQKNTKVHHNWFHDSYGPEYADGRCAGIYLDNDSKGYDVHHNVVWNVTWTGIQTNWDVWDNEIYNNTLWNVDEAMGAWLPNRNGYQTSIQRTKIYNNFASVPDWLGTDEQNNLIEHQDLFEDIAGANFTPKAGSALIDAGKIISGITDNYVGSAPDIGAYERNGDFWTAGAKNLAFCSDTWYLDSDNDGVGNADVYIEACEKPTGYAEAFGDLCPEDPAKTDPGKCGCGVLESTCTDEVSFTQQVTTVPSIKEIQVDLNYSASETRDLVLVLLDGNGAWVGNDVVTVNDGSGTQRMTITLSNPPTVGPSYRLDAYIRPEGGDYTANITSASRNVTVVASGAEDCAGVVDGIATIDGCGVCSGGSTGITPAYENCSVEEETVDFDQQYTLFSASTQIVVDVTYTANTQRDLVVLLNSPDGTWLGNGKATVNAGSGVETITVNLENQPLPGENYKLGVALRETGTGWEGNIDHKQVVVEITGIVTLNPYERPKNHGVDFDPKSGIIHLPMVQYGWKLYSIFGELLQETTASQINVSDLPKGIYLLRSDNTVMQLQIQ